MSGPNNDPGWSWKSPLVLVAIIAALITAVGGIIAAMVGGDEIINIVQNILPEQSEQDDDPSRDDDDTSSSSDDDDDTSSSSDDDDTDLKVGDSVEDRLAEDAFHEYSFSGHANTPLLFTAETEEELETKLEIYDSNERLILESPLIWVDREQFSFTPEKDGQYIARMVGKKNFGSYSLMLEYISGPPDERNKVNSIAPGDTVRGNLAEGAYDEYSFSGDANTPLLFTAETEEELETYLEIYDSNERLILESPLIWVDREQFSFTPEKDGQYIARMVGKKNFGSYLLVLEEM